MNKSVYSRKSVARLLRTLAMCLPAILAAPVLGQEAGERELFVAYGCYQCHGYDGQGGAALRIAPSPYPFEAFAALVRRPVNEMPAYPPSALSDEQLRAIYRYVRSVPEPPPLESLPLLR
jgi:mono/diheme cytochrome c family protein